MQVLDLHGTAAVLQLAFAANDEITAGSGTHLFPVRGAGMASLGTLRGIGTLVALSRNHKVPVTDSLSGLVYAVLVASSVERAALRQELTLHDLQVARQWPLKSATSTCPKRGHHAACKCRQNLNMA